MRIERPDRELTRAPRGEKWHQPASPDLGPDRQARPQNDAVPGEDEGEQQLRVVGAERSGDLNRLGVAVLIREAPSSRRFQIGVGKASVLAEIGWLLRWAPTVDVGRRCAEDKARS